MKDNKKSEDMSKLLHRRKIADLVGGAGMIMIAVGIMIPLFNLESRAILSLCQWIFTAGALIFTGSKCVSTLPSTASFRLKRLKRLEFWAGICFVIAAGFWFYNQQKYKNSVNAMHLKIIHDTILFTLSGAVLQLLAAWMIYFREKKEARQMQEATQKS